MREKAVNFVNYNTCCFSISSFSQFLELYVSLLSNVVVSLFSENWKLLINGKLSSSNLALSGELSHILFNRQLVCYVIVLYFNYCNNYGYRFLDTAISNR